MCVFVFTDDTNQEQKKKVRLERQFAELQEGRLPSHIHFLIFISF